MDLAELRARLAGPGHGPWRSLDAVAGTPAFARLLNAEFPAVTDLCTGPDRRVFLKLMAASLALAGLTGCDDSGSNTTTDGRTQERPFARNPAVFEPGATLSYASVALVDGYANGVLVSTRDGRPLKIEGNAQHPWSLGATDVFGQASVLGLYDPMRSQAVQRGGQPSGWSAFAKAVPLQGDGLRLLTPPVTSPTLLAQIAAMQRTYPDMHWHTHTPIDRTALYAAAEQAFGRQVDTLWDFAAARVIVSLDGDFLDPGPHQAGVARRWAEARRARGADGALLELHAAGPVPNLTSAKADFAVAVAPADMPALAAGLLEAVTGGTPEGVPSDGWLHRAAAALLAHRGAGLVVAGLAQPPAVQEAVHRINAALGNVGRTVRYVDPIAATGESLDALTAAIEAGEVTTLVMLDVNPVYEVPAFTQALASVKLKIHAGLYYDETAAHADWHLPLAHPLESWGDARSVDGTVGLMQPTIVPLYGGLSSAEILSLLSEATPRMARDMLRAHWGARADTAAWDAALSAGFIAGTAAPPAAVALRPASTQAAAEPVPGLTLVIRPDPTVWDGSLANNGWLQELPKPLTKIVWDHVFTVAPALAERQKLSNGDVVSVAVGGAAVSGPVWVLPGQADGTVGVSLGGGRAPVEMLFSGVGYDGYRLRAGGAWHVGGATITATGRRAPPATTQDHSTMEGHDLVRVQAPGKAVGDNSAFTQPTLYGAQATDGRAWGMVIDLDSCIGCNACVTACQAENNIAVVGRDQVALGREMHWLRVDRYYDGGLDAPATRFQPVPCMHCEDAPCEVGCPVEATLHDHEGLNQMVYNRCVGTRACSGYCPYKVRKFNYLDYSAGAAPSLELQRNPQVTVRARGVMEKCTYCVERIATARIDADKGDGQIADGAVQTACQGACPSRAIHFGDLADAGSAVAAARHDPRNYALLGELGVRPRTTYLAALGPAAAVGKS